MGADSREDADDVLIRRPALGWTNSDDDSHIRRLGPMMPYAQRRGMAHTAQGHKTYKTRYRGRYNNSKGGERKMSATSSTWSIATFDTCGMLILVVLRVSYFIRSTWYISCTSINTYPAGTRCTRLRFYPECTYLYSHNTKCSRSYFVVLYPAGIYEVYNKYISDSSHPSDTRRVSLHILLIDLYLTPVLLAWRSLSYCCSGI